MPHLLMIPPALHHVFKSVTLREDGSVIVEYIRPVTLLSLDYDGPSIGSVTCLIRQNQRADVIAIRAEPTS